MTSVDAQSDSELLLSDSSEAFAIFYRRHLAWVLRWLVGHVGQRDVAADLCAEVFASALRARSTFDARAVSAEPWLQRIARNILIDSVRKGQVEDRARQELGVRRLAITDDDLDRVDALVDEANGVAPALRALRLLPAEQSHAVRARVVEEQDYEVIAERLACSPAVVRQRVSRGLRTLRTKLENPS